MPLDTGGGVIGGTGGGFPVGPSPIDTSPTFDPGGGSSSSGGTSSSGGSWGSIGAGGLPGSAGQSWAAWLEALLGPLGGEGSLTPFGGFRQGLRRGIGIAHNDSRWRALMFHGRAAPVKTPLKYSL
jgi:hypothetical protein